MQKIIEGKVVSVKMKDTIIVEVTRKFPHGLYRKLMKKSKKYKTDRNGIEVNLGDNVKIVSTKPMSKEKYFRILKVIK